MKVRTLSVKFPTTRRGGILNRRVFLGAIAGALAGAAIVPVANKNAVVTEWADGPMAWSYWGGGR